MKSVFIIRGSSYEEELFRRFGWDISRTLEGSDLVLFTGGEDVSPELYGDAKHHSTYNNIHRDQAERELFDRARAEKIPMAGICRGGQFLNVMSGGRMYQDVENHTRSHLAFDETSDRRNKILVTSTHHQMMMPTKNAIMLLSADQKGRLTWMDSKGQTHSDVSNKDIEAVYYPETKSLCFQPHPEYSREHGDAFHDMAKLFFKYIDQWSLM